ncbi:Hypothetical_protein [Hexamita inflata]|uniref:Hypothetical_protein n=1 Tax=Hexamita inflata TaxID=28002 RepID=A0AA86NLS4_9EUKA|nr:Hypothetical protein HINF_LOCUS9202 [Hexamita inflata]
MEKQSSYNNQPSVQIIIGQTEQVVPVKLIHSENCDFYEFTYIHNQITSTMRISISSVSLSLSSNVQILIDQDKYIRPVNMYHAENGYIYEFDFLYNQVNCKMSIHVPHQPITAFKPLPTLKPFTPVHKSVNDQKQLNSVSKFTPLTIQKTTAQENNAQKQILTPFKPLHLKIYEPELQSEEEVEVIEETKSSLDENQKQKCDPVTVPDNSYLQPEVLIAKKILVQNKAITKIHEKAPQQAQNCAKTEPEQEEKAKIQEETQSNSSQEQLNDEKDSPALKENQTFVNLVTKTNDKQQKIICEQLNQILGSQNINHIEQVTPYEKILSMINNKDNQNNKEFRDYIQKTCLECLQKKEQEKQINIAVQKLDQEVLKQQKEQRIQNDNLRAFVIKNQVTQNIVNNIYQQETKPDNTMIDVQQSK